MTVRLEIVRIGRSAGVVLPEDVLAHLRVGVGGTLYVRETADGILLTASDPDLNTLEALAGAGQQDDLDTP